MSTLGKGPQATELKGSSGLGEVSFLGEIKMIFSGKKIVPEK